MPRLTLFIFALALSVSSTASAAPGLILRFADGEGKPIDARVARQVAIFVPKGEAGSAFSKSGQVRASWEGFLTLGSRSRLIFTLEGTGDATLTIGDEVLCEKFDTPSERKRLNSGEHPIKVTYTGPADGDAQLRLFWEGRDFGKEPVPTSAFAHSPEDQLLNDLTRLRLGHQLIAEHNCNGCHGKESQQEGPSLVDIGKRLQPEWIASWIADPKAHRPSARMPKLFQGENAAEKARDIAVFLGGQQHGRAIWEVNPNTAKKGAKLFYEQGCIGCHTLDATGDADRIGLGNVGHKFQTPALATYLRNPSKFHQATRMPDFALDQDEGNALAIYLHSLYKGKVNPELTGDPERGKKLFLTSGCINCHDTSDVKTELTPQKPATSANCSAADFAFTKTEQEAISHALKTPRPRQIPIETAAREFKTMRCAACHERDGQQPYRELLTAEVEHLKPAVDEEAHGVAVIPHLNQLGAKLRPDWRTKLFKGEINPKTRPWLKSRMPAFANRAEVLSAGFSHAAGLPAAHLELPAPDPENVEAGAEITGQTGFVCGTCHGIADKPPIAVFEGEGPNLRDAGARLRGEYFNLWMSDPPRLWPGTIMPKYTADGNSPLTQYYDGDAPMQFEAIYDYIRSLAE